MIQKLYTIGDYTINYLNGMSKNKTWKSIGGIAFSCIEEANKWGYDNLLKHEVFELYGYDKTFYEMDFDVMYQTRLILVKPTLMRRLPNQVCANIE